MQKRCLTFLLMWFCSFSLADTGDQPTLELQCYLSARRHSQFEDFFEVKTVRLQGLKHKSGGAIKVFAKQPYEFWTMLHKQQTSGNTPTAENFQVAVHNTNTGDFFHALSNSRSTTASEQLSARISLVEYSAHSMIEAGELLFECKTTL